jgi:hypothetical protein
MKSMHALPALLLALAVAAGCSSSSNPVADNGAGTNSAAVYASSAGVQAEANVLPAEEFEFDTYADGDVAKTDMGDPSFALQSGSEPTLDAAIDPGFWFRLIRKHERRYVVEITEPDTLTRVAHVRIIDRMLGTFNVVTRPDTIDGTIIPGERIEKPLADTSIRKAVFVRKRCIDGERDDDGREDAEDGYRDGWSRWRLRAVSGTEISSDDGSRQILSVRIQSGDLDVTITDPLQLRNRQDLLRLPPDVPVHVTATTADPTDRVLLYSRWGRMPLRRMADGTFQGRFRTPLMGGMKHIAVNALSNGTLADDVAPYDSKAWGLPYMVAMPEPMMASSAATN